MEDLPFPPRSIRELILEGGLIPAHPLALTRERKFDERRQRALTRYYLDAGVSGLAVAVHTTQFAIRDPAFGLLKPVLELAAETASSWTGRPVVMISGICGDTHQACGEARLARELGYHLGLLALRNDLDRDLEKLVSHVKAVAGEIPLMGFYLQEAVGGLNLSYRFWRSVLELPGLLAIKVAPFNRYRTCVVVRALRDSGRTDVALYTGNDDNMIADLLTPFMFDELRPGTVASKPTFFAGGLLGQCAVWTKKAVEIIEKVRAAAGKGKIAGEFFGKVPGEFFRKVPGEFLGKIPGEFLGKIPGELLLLSAQFTDINGALFDAANNFKGCIPGINEILRRQGLLASRFCLDPGEDLSPGQAEEINRVCRAYPDLADDKFVRAGLDKWLE